MGLFPRLELTPGVSDEIGYGAGADPVLAETGEDNELEITPVLKGIVGMTAELEWIGIVATPVLMGLDVAPVPDISDVDTGTVPAGELGIEVELA